MKLSLRLLLAAYSVFVCSTIINFIYGAGGIKQMGELLVYKSELEQNLSDLENKWENLSKSLNSLRENGEYALLGAHEINYFKENEVVVNFGFPLGNIENYDFGSITPKKKITAFELNKKHILSLIAGALAFLILTILYWNKNADKKRR